MLTEVMWEITEKSRKTPRSQLGKWVDQDAIRQGREGRKMTSVSPLELQVLGYVRVQMTSGLGPGNKKVEIRSWTASAPRASSCRKHTVKREDHS